MTKSIGVIVVNTYSMGLTYKPERGAVSVNELIESTKELFKKMQIQDVKVFKDYTKTELFD